MVDWKRLKVSLAILFELCQVCSNHGGDIYIFSRLRDCLQNSEDLVGSSQFLDQVLDVEASEQRGRFTVRAGVDSELDEKRRVHNGLPSLLLQVS